jgi:hypothetical protein
MMLSGADIARWRAIGMGVEGNHRSARADAIFSSWANTS